MNDLNTTKRYKGKQEARFLGMLSTSEKSYYCKYDELPGVVACPAITLPRKETPVMIQIIETPLKKDSVLF